MRRNQLLRHHPSRQAMPDLLKGVQDCRARSRYVRDGVPPAETKERPPPNCVTHLGAQFGSMKSSARARAQFAISARPTTGNGISGVAEPGLTIQQWMVRGELAIPEAPLPECVVPACLRESMNSTTKVCRLHYDRYMRGARGEPIDVWARLQLPHVGMDQFMLLNLPERLRWEVLYAVQQRAGRGGRIDPENTKAVIRIMAANPSFATLSKADVDRIAQRHNKTVGVHLHQFARALRNGYGAALGRSAKDSLVWDLDDVGFEPRPTVRHPGRRRRKCLDFGLITQPWLRELALAWAREEPQSYMIVKTHRAAVVASQALDNRRTVASISPPSAREMSMRSPKQSNG